MVSAAAVVVNCPPLLRRALPQLVVNPAPVGGRSEVQATQLQWAAAPGRADSRPALRERRLLLHGRL